MVPAMMPVGMTPCMQVEQEKQWMQRDRWANNAPSCNYGSNYNYGNRRQQGNSSMRRPQERTGTNKLGLVGGVKNEGLAAKKQDLSEFNTEPVAEITTLMVRGIPCSFSQDALIKTIDQAGLKGRYDFFYLPRAGNNGSNLGYAFINFTDQEGAEHCMGTFNGVPLDPSRSTKVCTISQA